MCWRTRSFSGWVSDQFHPASSGCEKNCQHQCFVLGGRVGNKGVFWPMGLMDCGSLSTQTPHRHCSVDSPFVPWTIPKFSFHHGKDTAGGVSLSSFNHCLVIKTTATHSFLSPPPSLAPATSNGQSWFFTKMVTPRDGYAFSHVWRKNPSPEQFTMKQRKRKHKNCSPNEEIPSARVCMWSTCLYVKLYGLLWLQWLWCWYWGSTT